MKDYIKAHKKDYYYGLSVDKHIFIDSKFVMGIECKAYTENAMIKRILVDFHLLKTVFPKISCYLFQLESQLGGVTLLKGGRDINRPIHKYIKKLERKEVEKATKIIEEDLRKYLVSIK